MTAARLQSLCALMLFALALAACTTRPVLYPNARGGSAGDPAAQAAIDECLALAKRDVGSGANAGELAERTAQGGVVGGVTGGAVGAVVGSVGRGAAAGAAGGAAHGLVRGLFEVRRPDSVARAYVERCLRERGYDILGWR